MKDRAAKIPIVLDMSFPQVWLDAKAEDDEAGRSNREVATEVSW